MRRIIVGITGASGSIYGIRLLEELCRQPEIEVHLVMSPAAEQVIEIETNDSPARLKELAGNVHEWNDISASIASGSFLVEAMVVAPCSMKTVAGVSLGLADNLLVRAADVCLKEKRRLIVLPRETPLHEGHLENLLRLARLGAIILPPLPAFYHRPESIDDLINQTIGKVLDLLGLPHLLYRRWVG